MAAENNKRIAKNTLYLYLRMFLIMGIQFYMSRELLRIIGVEDYGIYNVVGGVVTMMSFLNVSLANGFQRFFNVELGKNCKEGVKVYFSTALLIQFLCVVVLLSVLESVGLWFLNTQMTIPIDRNIAANLVYQSAILVFAISMLRAPFNAIIIAHERMDFFAYISIVEVLLNLSIIYLIPCVEYDSLIVYSLLISLVSIIVFFGYFIYVRYNFSYLSYRIVFDKKAILCMLGFSGWNLFGSLAHLLKGQGINIVLNLFFDPVVNAARGIAFQVSSGLSVFYSNFQMAARPQMIKSYAIGDLNTLKNLFYGISRYSFYLLWLFSLPILVDMEFVLSIWLGDNIPSLTPLFARLTVVTALVESFASPVTTIVHATGRMKKFQVICSSIILTIVPLSFLFLKWGFPPESAMFVSLIVVFIVHGVRLYLLRELIPFYPFDYIIKVLLPCAKVFVISLLFSFGIDNLNLNSILNLLLICIMNLFVIYWRGLNKEEHCYIESKLKRIYEIRIKKR